MGDFVVFSELSAKEKEPWNTGKAMYLAAALNKQYGCEIQITLHDTPSPGPRKKLSYDDARVMLEMLKSSTKVNGTHWIPYIVHAWVVVPVSGKCLDIDGIYHPEGNQWAELRDDCTVVQGLDEQKLRDIACTVSIRKISDVEWTGDITKAMKVVVENARELDKLFIAPIASRRPPRF